MISIQLIKVAQSKFQFSSEIGLSFAQIDDSCELHSDHQSMQRSCLNVEESRSCTDYS